MSRITQRHGREHEALGLLVAAAMMVQLVLGFNVPSATAVMPN